MNKTYIPTLAVLVLLAMLHYFATEYYLYVRYPGFDILMHILGGIGLSLAVYWVLSTFFKDYTITLPKVIILTILAGFAWETLEAYYDIAGAPIGTHAYYLDSAKDLINDTVGACISCFFLRKK